MIFTFDRCKKWGTKKKEIPGPRRLKKKWARDIVSSLLDTINKLKVKTYIIIYRPENNEISLFISSNKNLYIFDIKKSRLRYFVTVKTDNLKVRDLKFNSQRSLVEFIGRTLKDSINISERNRIILSRLREN